MMFCNPAFILFAVFKHREISYPAEAEFIFINEIHTARHFEAEFAKRLGDNFWLICNNENKISIFRFTEFTNFADLIFSEKFSNLAFQAAIFIKTDPCKPFRAIIPDIIH